MQHALALILCLGLAQTANAQGMSGGYIGFALGVVDYEEADEDLGETLSDTSSAYRVLGGYRFSDNFAVEGGWSRTSNLEESIVESIPFFGTLTLDVDAELEVLTVRALGFIPFSKVSLFGGAGYYDAEANVSVSVAGFGNAEGEGEASDSGATLSGGIQFDLKRVSIRGEYEWFDTSDEIDASGVGIGVLFRF
jgi:outer membrane protein with beta-barrel domain